MSDAGTVVRIYGHSYKIGSDQDGAEYIEQAAAYLDGKMRGAAQASGRRNPLEIAIQAAMEIADEVLTARRQKDSLLNQADERIDSFARRLETRADLFGPGESGAERR
ncbi:MAG: cell division protein ZapA [Gemmatimonadota bacterium]